MNNGQKIKYMELCLAVAREEVEYAELYKEKSRIMTRISMHGVYIRDRIEIPTRH